MLTEAQMLEVATAVSRLFELAGIVVIVLGALVAAVRGAFRGMLRPPRTDGEAPADFLADFRKTLGRSILTGLELLVAADIIRTVAVEPTMDNVLVLGVIVLIRTFLSMSLEVEINGRWPWQNAADERPPQRRDRDG